MDVEEPARVSTSGLTISLLRALDENHKKSLIDAVVRAGKVLSCDSRKLHNVTLDGITKVASFDYGISQDRRSEEIILIAIKSLRLDCLVIAEESGKAGNPEASLRFYIDPLDGSVNYSQGIPSYCVGLSAYVNKQPFLGIVYDPRHNELFVAERGRGVTINGNPVVWRESAAPVPLINLEWFGADDLVRVIAKLHAAGIRARIGGSGVLALVYAAIGRGDGAILLENEPWDVAPGLVFASELGCNYTTIDGQPIDVNAGKLSIVAGRFDIHQRILSISKAPIIELSGAPQCKTAGDYGLRMLRMVFSESHNFPALVGLGTLRVYQRPTIRWSCYFRVVR